MASYASTATFLRNSVFDAALEIGLADPRMAEWLEPVPELPSQEKVLPASEWPPSAESSPESEFSHSSHTTLTTIPSVSSHNSSPRKESLSISESNSPHRQAVKLPLQLALAPTKAEPEPSPPRKQGRKLLKLNRSPAPKKIVPPDQQRKQAPLGKVSEDPSIEERGRFGFLAREPTPPPEKKDSKSFFGRLRDRSRSKSRMRKAAKEKEDVRLSEDAVRISDESFGGEDRGRVTSPKRVQAVTVAMSDGMPQLQLDPPSNRQSSDLLKSLNEQLVPSSGGMALTYDSLTTSTILTPKPTLEATPTGSRFVSGPGTGPRHRTSVMDRPHPKIRTSGYWANRDRGVTTSRAGVVVRKASGTRKGPQRGSVTGSIKRGASGRRAALGGATVPRLLVARSPMTAIEEKTASANGRGRVVSPSPKFKATPPEAELLDGALSVGNGIKEVPPLQVPVIIERQPSTRRPSKPTPPLLSLSGLLPNPPDPADPSLQPPSPVRSPGGGRLRRHSHNLPPSPLKPPTSPLPPTPGPSLPASPAPSPKPTFPTLPTESVQHLEAPSRTVGVESPSEGRQSNWYEDESSDDDDGRSGVASSPRPPSPLVLTSGLSIPSSTRHATASNPSPSDAGAAASLVFAKKLEPGAGQPPPRRASATGAEGALTDSLLVPEAGSKKQRPPSPLTLGIPPSPRFAAAPLPIMTRARANTLDTPSSPLTVVTVPAPLTVRFADAVETMGDKLRSDVAVGAPTGPSAWNKAAAGGFSTRPSAMKPPSRPPPPPPISNDPPSLSNTALPANPTFLSVPSENGSGTLSRSPSLSTSGLQRGRASPFPTRPLPSLSRSPSTASINRRTESASPIPAAIAKLNDASRDLVRWQSIESNNTASDNGSGSSIRSGGSGSSVALSQGEISPVSGFLKRKPSVVGPVKVRQVERYNNMPLAAFIPVNQSEFESKEVASPSGSRSASPITIPSRANPLSRQNSASNVGGTMMSMRSMPSMQKLLQAQAQRSSPTPATLRVPESAPRPLSPSRSPPSVPSPSGPSSYRPSPTPPHASPRRPSTRPSPSIPSPSANPSRNSMQSLSSTFQPIKTLTRQGTFPSPSSTSTSRNSAWTQGSKSIYSTGEGDSESEDDDRFGLELDDDDDYDDSGSVDGGLDLIAAKLGGARAAARRKAFAPYGTTPPPLPSSEQNSPNNAPAPSRRPLEERMRSALKVPPSLGLLSPESTPAPSPRARPPQGAGGARWI